MPIILLVLISIFVFDINVPPPILFYLLFGCYTLFH